MRTLTDDERGAEARAIEARYQLPPGAISVEQRGATGRPRRYPDEHIALAVETAGGNRREAARVLGVSDSTVRDALRRIAAAKSAPGAGIEKKATCPREK